MARNIYFSEAVRSEQHLYENIIIESLKMYGQDLYYLPRTIVNENRILGEDVPSQFNNSYKIEMYIENTEGFDGEGDLLVSLSIAGLINVSLISIQFIAFIKPEES
jgi:hypothetical protein